MAGWVCRLALAAALVPAAALAQAEGEPEFWEVTGLGSARTLNLRDSASSGGAVVAELSSGTVLRNLGCEGEGPKRWCQVETADSGPRGWVSARYLADFVEPPPPAAAGTDLPPTGTVFCQLGDDPAQTCPYVTSRTEEGATEVVVTFADGFQRTLAFRGDDVWSPDPTDEVTARRADDKTVVEVNAVERLEIPDAVVRPN
jgi:hypothetical protein